VRTQDVRRAAEVLAEHGYRNRSAAPMRPVQEAALLRFLCELHFTRDDGRSQVDLHWDILPRMFAFALDTESLWTRSGRTSLGGTTVRTLSPEDLLLILCVHNTKHRWERLGWMVDVAELIERQAMDWDQVFDRACRLNSERMLRLGLFLASDLLGVALPPRVSDRAHADPTVRSLAIRAFEGLFTGPDTPTEEVVDFRFYFKARERWRDRARFTLQVITTPTLNEVSLVALPVGLSFLYYPLRPLRLAAKYGRALCART
jgi:putative nucleotidyltransferase-like protein